MSRRTGLGRPALAGTALALGLSGGLTGCGAQVPRPAPDGGTPACASLLERLPERVLERRRTDLEVAGVAAWGDPAIVLRCGVPPTGPTSAPCLEAGGLDWTFTETADDFRFVTYGRTPAVEVTLPTSSIDRTVAAGALVDLAPAVEPIPETAACV